MDSEETLLEFPCEFPIKAMGKSASGFEARALEIVRRHVADFQDENMRIVASGKGNYLSATFTIHATSKAQLDAIYRELTDCKDMLMVL
ncbi:Proposed lipoate regulatory protein YbeD [hydrothermal vent metagenome]|uniref:Proposed lipoate regulatory protein YbeD n=1 Tax=hydrothermal vent metagenome TaxID=652676 RepID=A0A3B0YCJ4_9ZZZZ